MPIIRSRDRWTQDSVWYNIQPVLQKYGIKVSRETVKRLIKVACRILNTTREALGIFAGARATMYFDGQWSSVSFDAIEELARDGTDVIIIEKTAIVQVLAPYADKYGVAIVNTSGYLTDYGKDLARAAKRAGAHVTIITDYDLHGLNIASKVSEVPRIGIDEETLNYFGLTHDDERVLSYSTAMQKRDFLSYYANVIDREFVEHSRFEIDGILAAVGSERLWEYIMQLFPKRDYNRVIQEQPVSSSPGAIGDVEEYIEYLKDKATRPRWEEIQKSLKDVEGMIDVPAKRKEIKDELQKLVDTDARMKIIVSKFEELKTQLGIDSDEDFAKYRKDIADEAAAIQAKTEKDSDEEGDDDEDFDEDEEAAK
jgi:Protein of unknown function C-terminus (DUF2399)